MMLVVVVVVLVWIVVMKVLVSPCLTAGTALAQLR